jgi:hypothetical protein
MHLRSREGNWGATEFSAPTTSLDMRQSRVRCLLMDARDHIGSLGHPGEPDQIDSDPQGEAIRRERHRGLVRKSIPQARWKPLPTRLPI